MLDKLDEILLSNNVVENFYINYSQPEFRNWIISILPEIEDCNVTKQDNPWHIYDCLGHILHSVNEINKQTAGLDLATRRMLAYTMLLHDIGKPECKIRRYSNLYGREVDSFFNHNLASVRIGERVLDKFKFKPHEKEMILKLVEHHDAFINFTLEPTTNKYKQQLTKDSVKNLINQLNINDNGLQMMDYLVMVAKADNLAQNPEMTQQSLRLIGEVKAILNANNQIRIS